MKIRSSWLLLGRGVARTWLVAVLVLLEPTIHAQGTGAIQGRVVNATNGSYLTNARVTVEGTRLETFTDRAGRYRLEAPAGSVRLHVFYTGLRAQNTIVVVQPDQTAMRDFDLVSVSSAPLAPGETVKLDPFTVAANREVDTAAIAINEQRFSPALKNVFSTDAFGDVVEGNLGEFAKFLPGVTIDYVSNDARTISLRGVASNYTLLTVDGAQLANANDSGGRQFEFEQVSVNSTSRVEIFKSRTPDVAANALGGLVNLVPRSAFERATATLNYRAFLALNSFERTLGRTRGPSGGPSRKIRPGFDFVYAKPVTKDFGFTFSALDSNVYNPQYFTTVVWAPNTTAGVGSTVENPYVSQYSAQTSPKDNRRQSVAVTSDWRFRPNDVLSVSAQWNHYEAFFAGRSANYTIGSAQPVAFDRTQTIGAPGRGTVGLISNGTTRKFGFTFATDAKWRHTGPVWRLDAGVAYSHASNHYADFEDNHFYSATLQLRGLPVSTTYNNYVPTVRFEELDRRGYLIPGRFTILDANASSPIDLSNVANYNITTTIPDSTLESADVFKTARFNARRDFRLALPFAIKAGAQAQEQTRDFNRERVGNYTFIGPDRLPNTADDNAGLYDIVDAPFAAGPLGYWNAPQVPFPSMWKFYDLLKAHPEYFVVADPTAIFSNTANDSKWFRETILSAYLMGDTRLMQNRLRLVGGVRFERTKDEGQGPLIDPLAARGIADPIAAARARFQTRVDKREATYNGAYPSIDATYNLTANVVVRGAYARSIGRPDLANIIPSVSLPDPGADSGTISVVNSSLNPTISDGYDLAFEYYFANTGVFSVGGFLKNFSDFVGTLPAQPVTRELLDQFAVPHPEAYLSGAFTLSSRINTGSARISGVEFNYSQVLNQPFLPVWARAVTVFANGQRLHLEGSTLADFSNFISASASWGIKYSTRRFTAQVNVNHRGRQRLLAQAFAPGAYIYNRPRAYIDGNIEYRFRPQLGVFLNARNLHNAPQTVESKAPATPDWARLRSRNTFGATYTFGMKGVF